MKNSQFANNAWTRVPSMDPATSGALIESGYAGPPGWAGMDYGQGIQGSMQGSPLLQGLRNPGILNDFSYMHQRPKR